MNADGSGGADARAWALKRKADAAAQVPHSGTDDEDAALEQALDAFQAGELSEDNCSLSGEQEEDELASDFGENDDRGNAAPQLPASAQVNTGSTTAVPCMDSDSAAAPPSFSRVRPVHLHTCV